MRVWKCERRCYLCEECFRTNPSSFQGKLFGYGVDCALFHPFFSPEVFVDIPRVRWGWLLPNLVCVRPLGTMPIVLTYNHFNLSEATAVGMYVLHHSNI
jgi:hypothetical protein